LPFTSTTCTTTLFSNSNKKLCNSSTHFVLMGECHMDKHIKPLHHCTIAPLMGFGFRMSLLSTHVDNFPPLKSVNSLFPLFNPPTSLFQTFSLAIDVVPFA
jgi:hypothetical protein